MTPAVTFAGKTVALFGLGGSGLATVRSLKAGGAEIVAWDDSPETVARAQAQGVTTGDLRQADWSWFSAFVLSPGVPLTHPEPHWTVPLAKAAGVEIIGDIEIFCRERARLAPDAPFVAITGTNGKSTTTALIAHLLAQAGRDVQMGGNIGTAILSLEPPSPQRVHVVELSTFQIDLTPSLNPNVGVLLNIAPDHLDRHGTMENYAAIKSRVFSDSNEIAVIGVDDNYCLGILEFYLEMEGPSAVKISGSTIDRRRIYESSMDFNSAVYAENRSIVSHRIIVPTRYGRGAPDENEWDERVVIADISRVSSLRGTHNAQNASAAVAVAQHFSVANSVIEAGLKNFPGLPHRMEEVGHRGRVLFVNDSKATNADSTEKALAAFRDVHWIVGGKAKEGGIAPLAPLFDRVAHAYLIGASSEVFARDLDGRVPFTLCGTLDVATAKAAEAAGASDAPEPVVLLSPACASYDQFRNFEERGDRFRTLVKALG